MEFNITGNVNLDTTQAENKLQSLVGDMSDIPSILGDGKNQPQNNLIQNANIKQVENSNKVGDSLNNLNDQLKDVIESFQSLSQTVQNNNLVNTTSIQDKERKDASSPQKNAVKGVNGVVGAEQRITSTINQLSNGDIAGAAISTVNNTGKDMMNLGDTVNGMGAGGLSKVLTGLGVGGLVIGGAAAGLNALSKNYERELPTIDELLSTFGGDIQSGNNSRKGMNLWNQVVEKNRGTGIDNETFLQLTNSLGNYGINNIDRASDLAASSAKWASYTNGDARTFSNFAGMIERYGGDGNKALNSAFQYSQASGLSRTQFSEFLDGLQKVVENGISNGFIKSTDEVADSLGMLARLSDNNPMWQGQQGVNRYMQMMNTASNNTSLDSASSVLMAKAANDVIKNTKGGLGALITDNNGKPMLDGFLHDANGNATNSVLNSLAYMEKGNMDPTFMRAYKQQLQNAYGNDVDSQVAALKQSYGLNWEGSIQLYNMMQKLGTDGYDDALFKKEAEKLQANPEYQSDNKRLNDTLSDLNETMVNFGKEVAFDLKIDAIDTIDKNVADILKVLTGDKEEKILDEQFENGVTADNTGIFSVPNNTYTAEDAALYGISVNPNPVHVSENGFNRYLLDMELEGEKTRKQYVKHGKHKGELEYEDVGEDLFAQYWFGDNTHKGLRGSEYETQVLKLADNFMTSRNGGANGSGTFDMNQLLPLIRDLYNALNDNTNATNKNTNEAVTVTIED